MVHSLKIKRFLSPAPPVKYGNFGGFYLFVCLFVMRTSGQGRNYLKIQEHKLKLLKNTMARLQFLHFCAHIWAGTWH